MTTEKEMGPVEGSQSGNTTPAETFIHINAKSESCKPVIELNAWGVDPLAKSRAYMVADLARSGLTPADFPFGVEPLAASDEMECYKIWYSKDYWKKKINRAEDKYIGIKGITPPIIFFGDFHGALVTATVEGYKKGLAFYLATGIPTIVIDGCWMFGEHVGDSYAKGLHSDIIQALQPGQLHLIFIDGDWVTNEYVKKAQATYRMLLEEQNVKFAFKDIGADAHDNRQGIDDWLVNRWGRDRSVWPEQADVLKAIFRDIPNVPNEALLQCARQYLLHDTKRFSKESLDLNDRGAASLIVKLVGADNFKFIRDTNTWVRWVDGQWENLDDFPISLVAEAATYYERRALVLQQHAKKYDKDPDKAKSFLDQARMYKKFADGPCSSTAGRRSIIGDLATRKEIRAKASDFDSIPHLLGVANGVVDLRTGEVRPERQEDMLLRHCTVPYGEAEPPRTFTVGGRTRDVAEFIAGMTGHTRDERQASQLDPVLAAYHQERTGAMLWGTNALQGLDIWNGPPATAKSTLLQIIRGALGETKEGGYFAQIPVGVLLTSNNVRNPEAATPFLMLTLGARIIGASEAKDTSVFNEVTVKQLSGDMSMSGRANYQDGGDIKITFNAIVVTNDLPAFNTSDAAFIERLCVTPFDVRWKRDKVEFLEEDKHLPDSDRWWVDEGHMHPTVREYVLWYLIQGCKRWQQRGKLPPAPERVAKQLRDYVQENDTFLDWMAECNWMFDADDCTLSGDLYRSFSDWSARSGRKPVNNKAFSKRLLKRFPKQLKTHKGTGNTNHIWGIRANK